MRLKMTFLGIALLATQSLMAQEATTSTADADSLALPEGMQQHEIDSLLYEWNIRNFLTLDDSCETSAENPTFAPEEYISRLQRLPNVMEMPYNDVVQKYIDLYSGRLRRSVSIMLGAANFYMPLFEEALESYQIPLELKYLPIIESALNPGAVSRAGAVGLWQFMITTGKQYGLEVTSLIDERRDPIKSSYAAARYLKDLYDIFGDWTLVIASYNCGPGNVNKAIKRAGGVRDYWQIYPYLPNETRGYVPAFIAANYIMNYYCDHNICPVGSTLPAGTDTLTLSRNIYMEQISAVCHIGMDELKALNPQFRTTLIPGDARACTLRMPAPAVNTFVEAGDSVYTCKIEGLKTGRKVVETAVKSKNEAPSPSGRASYVTVRDGDTLGAIARRNHTSIARLQSLNGMGRRTTIRSGQKLRVK
ncbi:MAG: transglycosylase SLT domain-containing protein [Bacteroidaceae bacterium]|nr:transglycosylase SLT domain-containing protein [Bacteroidaceae bacterium]